MMSQANKTPDAEEIEDIPTDDEGNEIVLIEGEFSKYGLKVIMPEPFLQKHFEQFSSEMFEFTKGVTVPGHVHNGYTVRTGINLKWIKGRSGESVGDWNGYEIVWAAAIIHAKMSEAMVEPANFG